MQNPKINNQITAEQLMIIGEQGQSLGLMSREEAMAKAKESGLDLIEIAPTAKPPVARIMSFDKYRYQQEKKLKKQKAGQKNLELKQVQISGRSALNDLQTRANQVNKFLNEGRPVNIILVLRGREKANKDWAKVKLEGFLKNMIKDYKVISPIKFMGRGMQVQILRQ